VLPVAKPSHAPKVRFGLDPLIAEAKQLLHRRRTVVLPIAVLVVAGAVGGWLALRSSGGVTGICAASPPSGWKERTLPNSALGPPTVVLTNFRFGSMDNFYGLGASTRYWPRGGITIAVSNVPRDATPSLRRALRITGADFQGLEGLTWPAAHVGIRSQGRVIDAYVEARTVTPAAIATVNRVLADVRACSA
jgi:hypothetical protein